MKILPLIFRNMSRLRRISVLSIIAGLFIVPIIVNWGTTAVGPKDFWDFISQKIEIQYYLIIVIFLTMLASVVIISSSYTDLFNNLVRIQQERDSLALYVEELREKQFVDPITGIPNNFLWREHLGRIIKKSLPRESVQAMIIDLVGFRDLNRLYGATTVDKILRKIAQDLRGGMRRNEQMYLRRRKDTPYGEDKDLPQKDIYRKYQGGDEFYLYIKGTESEAIGFLTRLQKNLRETISREVSQFITQKDVNLQFYAAVAPIFKDDNLEMVEARLDDLLIKAKYDESSRIIWYSQIDDAAPEYSQFELKLRQGAQEEFCK